MCLLYSLYSSQTDNSVAYTRGVLQTIGFKEFIPYLEQFNAANDQKIEEYLCLNAYKMPTEGNCIQRSRFFFAYYLMPLNFSHF